MKIVKKISLIIIGIILSLIILETGLQLAGFTLTAIKKYKNKITKDPNTITILCLGESTTDGQWPPILQKILDKKSPDKKFNVIDEGIVGTNTKLIAKKIKQNLLKYNPDIIITMIGINDVGQGYNHSEIKIFNLIQLILFHFKTHYLYTNASVIEIDAECMELRKLQNISLIKEKYYNLLRLSDFSDTYVYYRLWETINIPEEVDITFYDKLLEYNKPLISDLTLSYILKYFNTYKNYGTEQIKDFLINNKNRLIYDYTPANIIEILEKYDLPFLIKDIKKNIHTKNNRKKEVKENTIKNYNYILKESQLFNNKIIFIPMQYPTLSIEQLKDDLKDSPYYDKLIFVSNEENFKQALQKYKTEDIFIDMFGISFGHCTELGNTLIAENVAETILKLYN